MLENGSWTSKIVPTLRSVNRCCDGYEKVNKKCRLNLCHNRICQEDPQTKCITLEWCEQLVPLFVTHTGVISEVCTQPNEAQEHLNMCPHDASTLCHSSSCDSEENVACTNFKCDCTSGPVWLQASGEEANCSNQVDIDT